MRLWISLLAAALIAVAPASAQLAPSPEPRLALVIGNGAYKDQALRNPPNDARAVTASLRKLGFTVIERIDAGRRAMEEAVLEFGEKLKAGGVGLFYYAGHGVQARGHNYLVPVDAAITSEASVRVQALGVNLVLDLMADARNRANIVILDSCRNNPFLAATRGSKGLAAIDAARGTLIAYSTAPGAVAVDGEGAHSPYTAALVRNLDVPGLKAEELFKRVRGQVVDATKGTQTPWESSSLTGDLIINLNIMMMPPPAAAVPLPGRDPADVAFWTSIQTSNDPRDYEDYLKQFPNGTFSGLAQRRLHDLQRKQQAAAEEERKRVAAAEAEKQRLAALEAERQRKAAEDAERKRLAVEEAERKRKELEAERQRKAAEEAERRRVAAEEAERKRKEAEAERQRLAALQAERQRQEAEAEKRRLAAEEAERNRQEAEQRKRAEEAESKRAAAEAERQRLAAAEEAIRRQVEEGQRAAGQQQQAALPPPGIVTPSRHEFDGTWTGSGSGWRIELRIDGGYIQGRLSEDMGKSAELTGSIDTGVVTGGTRGGNLGGRVNIWGKMPSIMIGRGYNNSSTLTLRRSGAPPKSSQDPAAEPPTRSAAPVPASGSSPSGSTQTALLSPPAPAVPPPSASSPFEAFLLATRELVGEVGCWNKPTYTFSKLERTGSTEFKAKVLSQYFQYTKHHVATIRWTTDEMFIVIPVSQRGSFTLKLKIAGETLKGSGWGGGGCNFETSLRRVN